MGVYTVGKVGAVWVRMETPEGNGPAGELPSVRLERGGAVLRRLEIGAAADCRGTDGEEETAVAWVQRNGQELSRMYRSGKPYFISQ